MNKQRICAAFLSLLVLKGFAQQEKREDQVPQAVVASAIGDDSYLAFSGNTYKAGNKYTVFKVWKADSPLRESEKAELAAVKGLLLQKGVALVMVEWKTEEDLKTVFANYGIAATAKDGKHIRLQYGNSQLNTTASNALYVVENNKPVSLCSGSRCEDRLKYFFGLKALN